MNLSAIEKELIHLQALVGRWIEQKYTPDIERDIALERLRNIYAEFLSINAPAKNPSVETPMVDSVEHQVEEHVECEPEIVKEEECVEQNQAEQTCEDEHLGAQIEDIAQVIDDIVMPVYEPQIDQIPEEPVETVIHNEEREEMVYPEESEAQLPNEDEDRRGRFIHDLFCNDESFYVGEMRKIEALTSLDDVLIYIGQKYAWTPDNATAEEFVAWISTRFDN